MIKMNQIKWVILDLDNTLYEYSNPNEKWSEAILDYIQKKLDISQKEFQDAVSWARKKNHDTIFTHGASHSRLLYFQKALEKLTAKTHFALTLEMEELFWDTFMNHMKLNDGVIYFLDNLKKQNKKIVILTDLTAQIQMKKIIKLWIQEYIDYLVSSEESGAEKLDQRAFALSLEKLWLEKEEVCMIGDNYEKDIVWAKNFGIYKLYHKIDNNNTVWIDNSIEWVIQFSNFADIHKHILW